MEDRPRVGRVRRTYRKFKAGAKQRIERIKRAWRRDEDLREDVKDTAADTADDAITSYLTRKREPSVSRSTSRDSDGDGILESFGHVLYFILIGWWIDGD